MSYFSLNTYDVIGCKEELSPTIQENGQKLFINLDKLSHFTIRAVKSNPNFVWLHVDGIRGYVVELKELRANLPL